MSANTALSAPEQAYSLLYGSGGRLQAVHLESGRLLESVRCDYRQQISVRESQEFRWVHFHSRAIQTAMDPAEPWRLVMPCYRHFCAWQLFLDEPAKALILGVGGAALARYLRRYFPHIQLLGVEQSASMLQLSNRHFGLGQVADEVIQADALEFMRDPQSTEQCSDLIKVDLFARDVMPSGLWHLGFYEHCAASLRQSGVFVMNTIITDREAFSRLLALVRVAFGGRTLCLPVPGHDNIIILAFKAKREATLAALRNRADKLTHRFGMDFQHVLDQLVAVNPKRHGRFIMG